MPLFVWEILIILVLILGNGFFSAAEIAVIASRRGRLRELAEEGDKGAKQALELASDPGRFLTTVQVGITLIGTFTATFGGASLVHELADSLARVPLRSWSTMPTAWRWCSWAWRSRWRRSCWANWFPNGWPCIGPSNWPASPLRS